MEDSISAHFQRMAKQRQKFAIHWEFIFDESNIFNVAHLIKLFLACSYIQYVMYRGSALYPSPQKGALNRYSLLNRFILVLQIAIIR